jgi:hypothetical protein
VHHVCGLQLDGSALLQWIVRELVPEAVRQERRLHRADLLPYDGREAPAAAARVQGRTGVQRHSGLDDVPAVRELARLVLVHALPWLLGRSGHWVLHRIPVVGIVRVVLERPRLVHALPWLHDAVLVHGQRARVQQLQQQPDGVHRAIGLHVQRWNQHVQRLADDVRNVQHADDVHHARRLLVDGCVHRIAHDVRQLEFGSDDLPIAARLLVVDGNGRLRRNADAVQYAASGNLHYAAGM